MLRNAPKSSWNCFQCLSAKKAPDASALADSQGQHPWLWELSVLFRPSAPIPVPCCTLLCRDLAFTSGERLRSVSDCRTDISPRNGRQMQVLSPREAVGPGSGSCSPCCYGDAVPRLRITKVLHSSASTSVCSGMGSISWAMAVPVHVCVQRARAAASP